jgi:hypothetical protein
MLWRKYTTRDFTVLQWAIYPDGVEIIVAKKWKVGKRNHKNKNKVDVAFQVIGGFLTS